MREGHREVRTLVLAQHGFVRSTHLCMPSTKTSIFPFESNERSSERNLITISDLVSPSRSGFSFIGKGTINSPVSYLVYDSLKCRTTILFGRQNICYKVGSSISQHLRSKSPSVIDGATKRPSESAIGDPRGRNRQPWSATRCPEVRIC